MSKSICRFHACNQNGNLNFPGKARRAFRYRIPLTTHDGIAFPRHAVAYLSKVTGGFPSAARSDAGRPPDGASGVWGLCDPSGRLNERRRAGAAHRSAAGQPTGPRSDQFAVELEALESDWSFPDPLLLWPEPFPL